MSAVTIRILHLGQRGRPIGKSSGSGFCAVPTGITIWISFRSKNFNPAFGNCQSDPLKLTGSNFLSPTFS
jgi:hypothetical protein